MNKNVLLIGVILIILSSCKTFEVNKRAMDVPIKAKDFTVIGFVRVEGKSKKQETSYDQLLSNARKKYNNDKVDIVNIKTDIYSATSKRIINALVILYDDPEPAK